MELVLALALSACEVDPLRDERLEAHEAVLWFVQVHRPLCVLESGAVTLFTVTVGTRTDGVHPLVLTALSLWVDVVDRVTVATAVSAHVVVAPTNTSLGVVLGTRVERNLDGLEQPDNRRPRELKSLGPDGTAIAARLGDNCSAVKNQCESALDTGRAQFRV